MSRAARRPGCGDRGVKSTSLFDASAPGRTFSIVSQPPVATPDAGAVVGLRRTNSAACRRSFENHLYPPKHDGTVRRSDRRETNVSEIGLPVTKKRREG